MFLGLYPKCITCNGLTCGYASTYFFFTSILWLIHCCLHYTLYVNILHIHVQPGVALKLAKEGTETSTFWFALGGKQSYTSKNVTNDIVRDPHLFTLSFNRGKISCVVLLCIKFCYKIAYLFTDIWMFWPIINFVSSFATWMYQESYRWVCDCNFIMWTSTLLLGNLSAVYVF